MRLPGPLVLLPLVAGCGGASPLMHPAHPLAEDEVTVGAGFSGSFNVTPPDLQPTDRGEVIAEDAATSPGFAPWVGGRLGLAGDNEVGLTYSGRAARFDGRHAFLFGDEDEYAVSLGLGVSGILPDNRTDAYDTRISGFGGDVPLLFGFNSTGDVYSLYLGVRGGAEYLTGVITTARGPDPIFADTQLNLAQRLLGWHTHAGGLLGLRIGFRYLYAAFEVEGDMHWAELEVAEDLNVGAVGGRASFRTFAVRPAAAIIGRF